MSGPDSYREACVQADIARERLIDSARHAKARISPARLKQDAAAKAVGVALDGVALAAVKIEQRPVAFASAGAALALFLARRPIWALFQRLYVRFSNTNPDENLDLVENDRG